MGRTSSALRAAEQRAVTAERTLYVERARHAHGLPEEVVEFLTGDTEEEITAKAERLATLGKLREHEPSGDEGTPVKARPEPALTPGHGGTPPSSFSPWAVAAAAARTGEGR